MASPCISYRHSLLLVATILGVFLGCNFLLRSSILVQTSSARTPHSLTAQSFVEARIFHADTKVRQRNTLLLGDNIALQKNVDNGALDAVSTPRRGTSIAKTTTDSQDPVSSRKAIVLPAMAARSSTCSFNASVCQDAAYSTSGQTCCGGVCINVLTDSVNCGYCGNPCSVTEVCCKGRCTDLSKDSENCGRCGRSCLGEACQFGMCGYY